VATIIQEIPRESPDKLQGFFRLFRILKQYYLDDPGCVSKASMRLGHMGFDHVGRLRGDDVTLDFCTLGGKNERASTSRRAHHRRMLPLKPHAL
jgi:hypothetical protein